jgi:hypothetical protein
MFFKGGFSNDLLVCRRIRGCSVRLQLMMRLSLVVASRGTCNDAARDNVTLIHCCSSAKAFVLPRPLATLYLLVGMQPLCSKTYG